MLDKIELIDWQKVDGLIPAIIQDNRSGSVLMLGYMNPEALAHTLKTGQVTFYSRSKKRLWMKGESSGNVLKLKQIMLDCDQDSLLILVEPQGPTCHLGEISCFFKTEDFSWQTLTQLEGVIHDKLQSDDQLSYTVSLKEKGLDYVAQKVGEEAVETVVAALAQTSDQLTQESADLIYHLLVLLSLKDLSWQTVLDVLSERIRV